jgi:hypothetical protein
LNNFGNLGFLGGLSGHQTSIYDHRHVASMTALWDLGGIGTNNYSWVREILANMTLSGTYTYESPAPIPLSNGFNSGLGSSLTSSGVFVNQNGNGTGSGATPLTNSAGQVVGYMATNPNAQFIRGAAGTFANSGSVLFNDLRPINNIDAALFKRFSIRDRFSLELHGEAFNLVNHAQYVPGSLTTIGLGAQRQSLNSLIPGTIGFGDPTQAFSAHPRTMQVGIRVLW